MEKATDKQIGLMKKLELNWEAGCTKQDAHALIQAKIGKTETYTPKEQIRGLNSDHFVPQPPNFPNKQEISTQDSIFISYAKDLMCVSMQGDRILTLEDAVSIIKELIKVKWN